MQSDALSELSLLSSGQDPEGAGTKDKIQYLGQ